MKKRHLIQALVLAGILAFGFGRALAQEMEIDLGDAKPAPAAKPVQQAAPKASAPVQQAVPPTPVPEKVESAPQEGKVTEEVQEEPTPPPAVREVHGVLKAKDYYEAGKKYYKKKEYDQAAKYWKKAVEKKDPYTPKYVYAEANAMLGVIYQFRMVHYKTAYHYYQAALKYEKNNKTAKKHIKEVLKKKEEQVLELKSN